MKDKQYMVAVKLTWEALCEKLGIKEHPLRIVLDDAREGMKIYISDSTKLSPRLEGDEIREISLDYYLDKDNK